MRLLVLGQGPLPLPSENNLRTNATALRTWHFARALFEVGQQVTIVGIDDTTSSLGSSYQIEVGLNYNAVTTQLLTQPEFLPQFCLELKIEAVIAASIFPAYLAALYLPAELPLWADFFGSPLAEGQAKAFVHHDDRLLEPYARFERLVVGRADAFSTVSSYQKYALVGALATRGRLNQYSYGHDFVRVIPAAVDTTILPHSAIVLRGKLLPADAFVILWSGGYNTWTDVATLFNGLETAMATRPEIHFVSTGGSLPSHDETTYAQFCQLVAASPYQNRFHLLGWLPLSSLHNYYYEADLGIILDKWSYEGVLGSRTRLLDWLKYGLPAITTVTAELTEMLVQQNLGFSFEHGDSNALAAQLVELSQNRLGLHAVSKRASEWVLQNFAYSKVCQPLIEWAAAPQRAPDAGQVLSLDSSSSDLTAEQQLANLISQLDQKNLHLAQVEIWAHELEARLKNYQAAGYLSKSKQALANVFKKRNASEKNKTV